LSKFEPFDPAPGEYNLSIRNDFEIGPLNPETAEIYKAKDTASARIGLHVPGKPSRHPLRVRQKSKYCRCRSANSYFVPYSLSVLCFHLDRPASPPTLAMRCRVDLERSLARTIEATMARNALVCKVSPNVVARFAMPARNWDGPEIAAIRPRYAQGGSLAFNEAGCQEPALRSGRGSAVEHPVGAKGAPRGASGGRVDENPAGKLFHARSEAEGGAHLGLDCPSFVPVWNADWAGVRQISIASWACFRGRSRKSLAMMLT
jgi:hypothetical protein